MEVVVHRPDGYALPEAIMQKARLAAAASGGSVRETEDRDDAMEGAEAAQVHITAGTIPANFLDNADYADKFNNYAEWPVEVGSCSFYIDSAATAPDFLAVSN